MAKTQYTTIANVQNRLGKTFTGADINKVNSLIAMVTAFIENYTDRVFYETDEVTQTYRGFSNKAPQDYPMSKLSPWAYVSKDIFELELIQEWQSITKVEAFDRYGESVKVYEAYEYEALPYNNGYFSYLHALDYSFTDYIYKVTGTMGYCKTVPDDITGAATEIVASIITTPVGIKKEMIEGYTYEMADVVAGNSVVSQTLDAYKKPVV